MPRAANPYDGKSQRILNAVEILTLPDCTLAESGGGRRLSVRDPHFIRKQAAETEPQIFALTD